MTDLIILVNKFLIRFRLLWLVLPKKGRLIRNDDTEVTVSNDTERNVVADTEDWVEELWRVCLGQCEDTKKPLLDHFAKNLMLKLVAGAAIVAATIILKGVR